MTERKWKVYLLRCADNSLYCGITHDIQSRVDVHNSGKGAKYTRSRRPVELVAATKSMTKSQALTLESMIKRMPADEKIAALKRFSESEREVFAGS
jgi:putative endonuclease